MLLSNDGANAFVQQYYTYRVGFLNVLLTFKSPAFRSQLLRYMLLEAVGGIYSGFDVICNVPIEERIPEELKPQVHVVVGVQYDHLDRTSFCGKDEPIQFYPWSVAASSNHPVMQRAITTFVASLQADASRNGTTKCRYRSSARLYCRE